MSFHSQSSCPDLIHRLCVEHQAISHLKSSARNSMKVTTTWSTAGVWALSCSACTQLLCIPCLLFSNVSLYRLTNTNPFIEDEEQRDIRTRISERRVDWDTLERKCVSNYGALSSTPPPSTVESHAIFLNCSQKLYSMPSARRPQETNDPRQLTSAPLVRRRGCSRR